MADKKIFTKDVSKYKKQDIIAARKWFREMVKTLGKPTGKMKDLRSRRKTARDILGAMVFFRYDPKYKEVLPYYDTFPLSIIIDVQKDSMLGLNLHYLPPKLREIFLSRLFDTLSDTNFDQETKLEATYGLLKAASKYKYFKPCIKRYLFTHLKTQVQIVRPQQWPKAILLPVADFRKSSSSNVWKDSRSML